MSGTYDHLLRILPELDMSIFIRNIDVVFLQRFSKEGIDRDDGKRVVKVILDE